MSKFMKKAFAVAMTFALVLCMSVSAFAAEGDSTGTTAELKDQSTVTITKVYKLNGSGTSPEETFTLEQVGAGKVIDGDATISVPDLRSITGAEFAKGAATTNGAEGKITIALPDYEKVGVYEYTLQEVAGNTAGVTYYGDTIRLVVTVVNDGNNKLRVAAVHTETVGAAQKSSSFENTYSANDLRITKTVTGNLGDKSKSFEFTVTLNGKDGKTYAASYSAEGGSADENNPESIKIGEPTTIHLKDGETFLISGLPEGVTYTVSEADYTGDGYTTTKTDDTGTISAAAASTAAFTNTKTGKIDTGVILHSAPYVLVLAGVAAAGVVFAVTKKRRAE